jgi:hypothetical protein
MARVAKYIHLTDTEIDDLINNFTEMLCLVDDGVYEMYLKEYQSIDYTNR